MTSAKSDMERGEKEDDEDVMIEIPIPIVNAKELEKVVEFILLQHHDKKVLAIPKPLESFDLSEFVRPRYFDFANVDKEMLFLMLKASDYLDIKPLMDLLCAVILSNVFTLSTAGEIRNYFNNSSSSSSSSSQDTFLSLDLMRLLGEFINFRKMSLHLLYSLRELFGINENLWKGILVENLEKIAEPKKKDKPNQNFYGSLVEKRILPTLCNECGCVGTYRKRPYTHQLLNTCTCLDCQPIIVQTQALKKYFLPSKEHLPRGYLTNARSYSLTLYLENEVMDAAISYHGSEEALEKAEEDAIENKKRKRERSDEIVEENKAKKIRADAKVAQNNAKLQDRTTAFKEFLLSRDTNQSDFLRLLFQTRSVEFVFGDYFDGSKANPSQSLSKLTKHCDIVSFLFDSCSDVGESSSSSSLSQQAAAITSSDKIGTLPKLEEGTNSHSSATSSSSSSSNSIRKAESASSDKTRFIPYIGEFLLTSGTYKKYKGEGQELLRLLLEASPKTMDESFPRRIKCMTKAGRTALLKLLFLRKEASIHAPLPIFQNLYVLRNTFLNGDQFLDPYYVCEKLLVASQ